MSLHLNIRAHPFPRLVIIRSANAQRITEADKCHSELQRYFGKGQKNKIII